MIEVPIKKGGCRPRKVVVEPVVVEPGPSLKRKAKEVPENKYSKRINTKKQLIIFINCNYFQMY